MPVIPRLFNSAGAPLVAGSGGYAAYSFVPLFHLAPTPPPATGEEGTRDDAFKGEFKIFGFLRHPQVGSPVLAGCIPSHTQGFSAAIDGAVRR